MSLVIHVHNSTILKKKMNRKKKKRTKSIAHLSFHKYLQSPYKELFARKFSFIKFSLANLTNKRTKNESFFLSRTTNENIFSICFYYFYNYQIPFFKQFFLGINMIGHFVKEL